MDILFMLPPNFSISLSYFLQFNLGKSIGKFGVWRNSQEDTHLKILWEFDKVFLYLFTIFEASLKICDSGFQSRIFLFKTNLWNIRSVELHYEVSTREKLTLRLFNSITSFSNLIIVRWLSVTNVSFSKSFFEASSCSFFNFLNRLRVLSKFDRIRSSSSVRLRIIVSLDCSSDCCCSSNKNHSVSKT